MFCFLSLSCKTITPNVLGFLFQEVRRIPVLIVGILVDMVEDILEGHHLTVFSFFSRPVQTSWLVGEQQRCRGPYY